MIFIVRYKSCDKSWAAPNNLYFFKQLSHSTFDNQFSMNIYIYSLISFSDSLIFLGSSTPFFCKSWSRRFSICSFDPLRPRTTWVERVLIMRILPRCREYLGRPDKVLLFPLLRPAHRSHSRQVSQVVEFVGKFDQFGLMVTSFYF